MTDTMRICVKCSFSAVNENRDFLTTDGQNAVDKLIDELDNKKIGNQSGKLVFEPVSQIPVARIEKDSIFRWFAGTRIFITHNNNEAVNMLMHKLVRKGVMKHSGTLCFEFIARDTVADICICGHNRYAHKRNRYGYSDRGRCEVAGCECRRFEEKSKEVSE